jgi:hypothetical protein
MCRPPAIEPVSYDFAEKPSDALGIVRAFVRDMTMKQTKAELVGNYTAACAALETARAKVAAAKPAWLAEHPEPADVNSEAWEDWADAEDAMTGRLGLWAAGDAKFATESALIRWFQPIAEQMMRDAGRSAQEIQDIRCASQYHGTRARFVKAALLAARS